MASRDGPGLPQPPATYGLPASVTTRGARAVRAVIAIVTGIVLAASATSPRAASGDAKVVVATIGSQEVTQQQLEDRVRGKLVELETARYEILREGLDELIDEILLEQAATAQNKTPEELLKQEVEDKVTALDATNPISAEQVDQFYAEYKDRLGDRPLEELRPSIERYLQAQRMETARVDFTETLRKNASVSVRLQAPTVEVSAEGPARGPQDAAVTIVEFSDFECPFCQRAAETVDKIVAEYGDRVRLVYRHYPLPSHANARRAAEASACAHEAGKFWPYHDLLFKNQDALAETDLITYAQEAGIDEASFRSCLESDRGTAIVDKDAADGDAAGVSGTPAFFVNGRPLSGALPYETFKEAVDEAMAQRGSPAGGQGETITERSRAGS